MVELTCTHCGVAIREKNQVMCRSDGVTVELTYVRCGGSIPVRNQKDEWFRR